MKKELIDRLGKLRLVKHLYLHDDEISCLEDTITFLEELPDFQRIDEERMREVFMKHPNSRHIKYDNSFIVRLIKEYNSTLPTALVPLPKEMPALWHDAFTDLLHNRMQPSEFYSLIRNTYGTPQKQNLPSVEELAKEMLNVWNVNTFNEVAEYVINKYSLHTREWWQDLKEGDKFMWKGQVKTFRGYEIEHKLYIEPFPSMVYCPASDCTPYTHPTAEDIIAKHNLTEEEVKAIREGKCT